MFLRKEVRHALGVLKGSWGIIYTAVASGGKNKGKPPQDEVRWVWQL